MYLTLDIGTPVLSAYLNNKRVQNEFVRNFPTTVIDDTLVFDRLTFYNGSHVNTSSEAKNIYKLLGTSVSDLNSTSYNGIDEAWIYLKPYHLSPPSITTAEISNFINTYSTLDQELTVEIGYTQVVANQALLALPVVTNDQILDMVISGYDSVYPADVIPNEATGNVVDIKVYDSTLVTYDTSVSKITFAAIIDNSNTLFTTTGSVTKKSIVPVYSSSIYIDTVTVSSYTIQAVVEFKFKRVKDASDASCAGVISTIQSITNEGVLGKSAFYEQITTLQHFISPVLDDELSMSTITANGIDNNGNPDFIIDEYIKVAGASQLKPKEFTVMLAKSVSTDFHLESGDWWVPILAIVIIIIVIWATWGTGAPAAGSLIAAGLSADAAAVVVFLSSLAFSLSLSMVALSLVAMAMQKHGDYGNAIAMQGSITTLGVATRVIGAILTIIGIGAVISAIREYASTLATTALVEASKEGSTVVLTNTVAVAPSAVTPSLTNWVEAVIDYASDSVTGVFTNKSVISVITSITEKLNMAFSIYADYISPPETVDQTSTPPEEVLSIASAKMVQINFESYGFTDLNEVMDTMPYNLTQKKVDEGVSRFYEG